MPRNNQRGSKNNNPEGRNQYSNGWMDSARERPMAAAAAAAAAVGAGVFLWSRRNQISEQISNLSDQIGEWTENMGGQDRQLEMAGGEGEFASNGTGSTGSMGSSKSSGSGTSRRGGSGKSGSAGMSETGGGNASLGAHSGGSGMSGRTRT